MSAKTGVAVSPSCCGENLNTALSPCLEQRFTFETLNLGSWIVWPKPGRVCAVIGTHQLWS